MKRALRIEERLYRLRHTRMAQANYLTDILRLVNTHQVEVKLKCGCGQPLFKHVDGYWACPACEQY